MSARKLAEVMKVRDNEIVGRPYPIRIVEVGMPGAWIATAIVTAFVAGAMICPLILAVKVGE